MSPKRARFVQEYLVDRNGAAAAVRAGYSQRSARQQAYDLLTSPDIAAAVREGEARLARDAKLNRAVVLKGLQEAIALARARADASAMIAGWREVAKMCGYYAPERKHVQLSTEACATVQGLQEMTDEELAEVIAIGAEAKG